MRFPESFLFGASTAAYQIEGAVKEDGRGPSIWDVFAHTPGKTAGGDTGDRACDHYHRFREDVALLAGAGLGAYRFSVAWPRVAPTGYGSVNPRGLDFYDRLTDTLLEAGIEPWPCLYHWDLPQALEERGGWTVRDTAGRFSDYAAVVMSRLGDRIRRLVLLNEPNVAAVFGYLIGNHAPGRRSMDACLAATHHLNLATGLAAQAVRAAHPTVELGSALALNWVEPATDHDQDIEAAERFERFFHGAYLEPALRGRYPDDVERRLRPWVGDGDLAACHGAFDFLGVNYYTRLLIVHRTGGRLFECWIAAPPPRAEITDMGWEVQPDSLLYRLVKLAADYPELPLYITENGAAFPDQEDAHGQVDDPARIRYLEEHLERCLVAIDRGVALRGYFVWSILDNFEWAEGYDKCFGLVGVDYETLARTPKASYRWFTKVATSRELGS